MPKETKLNNTMKDDARLNNVQVSKLLATLEAQTQAFADKGFKKTLMSLGRQLDAFATESANDAETVYYFDQRLLFDKKTDTLQEQFLVTIAQIFQRFANGNLATRTGKEKYNQDMLSLVENEDLEETIAISSITRAGEKKYARELWELNQRLQYIKGLETLKLEQNPVSPIQFCEAARQALFELDSDVKIKILMYRTLNRIFIPTLTDLYKQLNDIFIERDILPNLKYSVGAKRGVQADGSQDSVPESAISSSDGSSADNAVSAQAMDSHSVDSGQSQAAAQVMPTVDAACPTDQYQSQLLEAIQFLQNHVHHAQGQGAPTSPIVITGVAPKHDSPVQQSPVTSHSSLGPRLPSAQGFVPTSGAVSVFSGEQLLSVIQNLQSGLSQTAVPGIQQATMGSGDCSLPTQSVSQVSSQLNSKLLESTEKANTEKDSQDLDQAVDPSDMQVIDLVGMLFDYMLSDDNLPSPVKALLSYLHTPFLKIAFLDPDFFKLADHPARLLLNSLAEAGTCWVSNDGTAQYEIYPRIKSVVTRVIEEFQNDVQLFSELLDDFNDYTQKISRRQELIERRAMEKEQGEERLREVKIKVNREVIQRIEGKELPSVILLLLLQPWSDYLVFVLLRSGWGSEDWLQGLETIDNIILSVQPKEKSEDSRGYLQVIEELAAELERGFSTVAYDELKASELIGELKSLQIMAFESRVIEAASESTRAELEAEAAEKAGQVTVDENISEQEQSMIDSLKTMDFGNWFELGNGKRVKVAWYNSKTLRYMLVDQIGKKVALKTELEFARDILSGEAKVMASSSKPFFERALESIFQGLNTRTGTLISR